MLTEISNKFIQLTETVLHKVYKTPQSKLGQPATKLLSLLFNRVAHANALWEQNKSTIVYNSITINKPDMSSYPTDLQQSIENTIHWYNTIMFKVGEREVILVIGNTTKPTKYDVDRIVKRVYMWLNVASFFADVKCSQTLTIYLSMVNDIKQLPTTNLQHINREHVNTAYTYSCTKNNEIHIFRREEWFKVLIHETFHGFGLDFSEFNFTVTNNMILKIFHVIADVRIFESYCEIWAELINNIFVVFFSTKWNENQAKWLQTCVNKLHVLIFNEQVFSMFQCAKILTHFNIEYNDLLYANNQTKNPNKNYRDKTHVLSYYIIKTILLYHINDFIEECIHMNGYSIQFDKNANRINENMHKYCQLVNKLHKNPPFITELNNMSRFMSHAKYKHLANYVKQSLRMALYEMK